MLYCVVVVIMITVVHVSVLFFVFTEGIQPLIGLLNSETPDVREASSLALANITTSNRTNCRYRQRCEVEVVFVCLCVCVCVCVCVCLCVCVCVCVVFVFVLCLYLLCCVYEVM